MPASNGEIEIGAEKRANFSDCLATRGVFQTHRCCHRSRQGNSATLGGSWAGREHKPTELTVLYQQRATRAEFGAESRPLGYVREFLLQARSEVIAGVSLRIHQDLAIHKRYLPLDLQLVLIRYLGRHSPLQSLRQIEYRLGLVRSVLSCGLTRYDGA